MNQQFHSNSLHQKTVLPNGLRVLTASMPHALSVAISIYLGAGSRYESAPESGVSHFVEHLCFKGTEQRPTPKDVAETIDRVGGVLNAATDRELTVYYAKVARPHLELALDILADLVCNPIFDPQEMEKERHVILEELAAVEDSPSQMVDLLLDATIWPDQPLGWDVAGTPESVTAISRPSALSYLQRQYVPNNAVISVAGNVEHQQVVDIIAGTVSGWNPGQPSAWFPARNGHRAHLGLRYKRTEQAHLVLAVPGIPIDHPDRQVLSMLSIILGESMSSRLFMELRERRALAYEVSSYVTHFLDTGLFSVYVAVDPKRATEAIPPALEELAKLRDEAVTDEELARAREIAKGRLLLRMEDTRNVSGWLGSQELLAGRVRSVEEVVTAVDAVTADDIWRLSRELFRQEQLFAAVVGPYRTDKRFLPLLAL